MRFPYHLGSGGQYSPIIPLTVLYGEQKYDVRALVDSGASLSIFRAEVADLLGIDIESGRRAVLAGVGGRILGYVHQLELIVAGVTFSCQVAFSRELHISLNLLGRQDCFQHFFIIFDEMAREVIFIPREESGNVTSTQRRKSFGGLDGQGAASVGPVERLSHRAVEVVNEVQDTLPQIVN